MWCVADSSRASSITVGLFSKVGFTSSSFLWAFFPSSLVVATGVVVAGAGCTLPNSSAHTFFPVS